MMKRNHSGGVLKANCFGQMGWNKRMIFHQIVLQLYKGRQRYVCQMQNVIFWLECLVVSDQKDNEGICQRGN